MHTTVTQGSIGLSSAIYKLTELGYRVSIPLIDNQEYDLIVDNGDRLLKVEVKSTSVRCSTGWTVQIKKVRSNKSSNNISPFDGSVIDLLFIYTMEGDSYLIPSSKIDTRNQLTVPGKYLEYRL